MTTLAELARTAVPYGLPTVDLHRILVNFALDPESPEFKAPLNAIHHSRGLDLRSGPVVLTMPAHDADRYMSAQIVDLYTNILGYVSPRTFGHGGGRYAVRGPAGGTASGEVAAVFECPTDLALVLVRTQLFDDADIVNVAALQDQVVVMATGAALPMPAGVPTVDVRAPLDGSFLRALDWMLQFMPTLPEDDGIREELSGLGVGVGMVDALLAEPAVDAEERQGLAEGMRDVQARCAAVRSSAELFGSREFYAGDHLRRAAGTFLGILGNAVEEYLGVGYRADENGEPFDGARSYTITFPPGGTPDVGAFWSITLYDDAGHLYANPLDRYVLGSRQLGGMVRDEDGSLTFRVQHVQPPEEQVATWLPCPAGPFGLTFRTYLPGASVRDGSWTAPPVRVTGAGGAS